MVIKNQFHLLFSKYIPKHSSNLMCVQMYCILYEVMRFLIIKSCVCLLFLLKNRFRLLFFSIRSLICLEMYCILYEVMRLLIFEKLRIYIQLPLRNHHFSCKICMIFGRQNLLLKLTPAQLKLLETFSFASNYSVY